MEGHRDDTDRAGGGAISQGVCPSFFFFLFFFPTLLLYVHNMYLRAICKLEGTICSIHVNFEPNKNLLNVESG